MEQELVIVSQSRYDFATTVDKLSEKIIATGWKIMLTHDFQEILRKNGKDVLPIKVIEICKPEYSGKLLEKDALKAYSPLMPCRISVYQNTTGDVFISQINVPVMATPIGGLLEEVMLKAFTEMDTLIKEISQ